MPDIYDRAKALAARQLAPRPAGKGLLFVLTRKTPAGEYDPATGTGGQSDTTVVGSGIRTNYDTRDVDDTRIRTGDVKLLLSPVTLSGGDLPPPAPGDEIVFDTSTYMVVACAPIEPADLACGFKVQARP